MISHLLNVLFPRLCISCQNHLFRGEEHVCIRCLAWLPKTFHWNQPTNSMYQSLASQAPMDFAMAYMYYSRKSRSANILHAIKYKNEPKAAVKLGHMFGKTLSKAYEFHDGDALVPIPLHPSKLLIRGYNQSSKIATGIAEVLGIPVLEDVLGRIHNNVSQTRKSRLHRWENSTSIFKANTVHPGISRIILVDDVYTTGATMIAASNTLINQNQSLRLGALTLARSRE